MRRLLCCWMLLLLPLAEAAQALHTYHYGVDDGLPSSEVYDILQDKSGFIWLATDRGVSRYDGYTFTNFTTDDGLTDNTIFNLFEDRTGRIWMTTFSGRICYYANGLIYAYRYNDSLQRFLPQPRLVRTLGWESGDRLLLGTLTGGLISIDANGRISMLDSTLKSGIYQACTIGDRLMFGFDYRFKPGDATPVKDFLHVKLGRTDTLLDVDAGGVRPGITGLRRLDGSYCFSVRHTVFNFDARGKFTVADSSVEAIRICEDRDSCLWVSCGMNGVRRYAPNAPAEGNDYELFFPDKGVTKVYEDREGGFWFATLNNGVYYAPSLNVRHYLEGKIAYSLTGDASQLYAGCRHDSVYRWNGQTFRVLPGSGEEVYDLIGYDAGRRCLWLNGQRLMRLDSNGTYQREPYQFQVARALGIGTDGTLYCGTYRGLFTYQPRGQNQQLNHRRPIRVESVLVSQTGKIWAGSTDGLYSYDGTQLTPAAGSDSLLHARISGLTEMSDGTLVIATIGSGILLRQRAKPLNISVRQGLVSNIVNAAAIDGQGRIWAATNRGVSCIRLSGDTFTIRNYGLEHGLPSNEVRAIRILRDTLWLAGATGIVAFCPDAIAPNTVAPPVYLRQVHCGDSILPGAGDVVLSHRQNLLRFDFTGISFRQRGKITYRYRLLGLSEQWTFTTTPSVQFTALPPGSYTFEVAARNEDGVWSPLPATYAFSIRPPFWATWWFISLLMLAAGTLIWTGMTLRIRQIRRSNALREQTMEYHQQLLAAQMNPHFIFNALNSMQSYIAVEDRRSAMKFLSRFSRLMRASLDHSRQRYVALHDELELIRLYLEIESFRFREKISWTVELDPHINSIGVQVPAMIIQPYIENALRHGVLTKADGEGHITVRVSLHDELMLCTVEDNGIGRAAAAALRGDETHRSAGTSITGERLRLACAMLGQRFFLAVIDKNDEEGRACGTIVKFALPYFRRT